MAGHEEGETEAEIGDPAREALRAGHPVAWAVLVTGTSLEGTPWPGCGTSGWDAPLPGIG